MWRNRRRMFEYVVNRLEMQMTNDQCWFLIKLMPVLFTKLCLIESGGFKRNHQDYRNLLCVGLFFPMDLNHLQPTVLLEFSLNVNRLIDEWKMDGHLQLFWAFVHEQGQGFSVFVQPLFMSSFPFCTAKHLRRLSAPLHWQYQHLYTGNRPYKSSTNPRWGNIFHSQLVILWITSAAHWKRGF